MKKYKLLILLLSVCTTGAFAQLVNQGGTITIQPNATLIVESDITNTTGTITNNGSIEVTGDLTNNATITSGAGSKIIFKGTTDSDLKSGGATFAIVENDKTSGKVILTENAAIAESVDFSGGASNIDLANFDLTLSEAATTNGSQATGWFETSGTGLLTKELTAAATSGFDVGDGTNYTPVSVAHTGTYAGGSTIAAKVTGAAHPNQPAEVDDYIARYWSVSNSNITSPSMAMTGTYVAGDVNGTTSSNIKGARYESGAWEYATGGATGMNVIATSTASGSDLAGTNFFGKADLLVFLEGGYAGSSMMTTNLNAVIPLTSPYVDAPATAVSIPATAVDWVKLETREAGSSSTVIGKTSAFLLNDGSIVGLDGTSLPELKDASTGYIAIYHRNHLPIRSSTVLDFGNVSQYSMTTLANVYDDASVSNDAMNDLGGGVFGMIGGDSNGDGFVRYTDGFIPPATFIDSDGVEIFSVLGNVSNAQISGYNNADINMDGYVRYTDGFVPPATFIDSDAVRVFSILGNITNAQLTQNLD